MTQDATTEDRPDDTAADELFEASLRAAWDSIPEGGLDDMTPEILARALRAAQAVYADDDERRLQALMDQVGFGGMEIGHGVKVRIRQATEVAAGMVKAFDALLDAHGAENYVEMEQTVTDPDPDNWRRYRVIIVRPGKPSPHELRQKANQRAAELAEELAFVEQQRDQLRGEAERKLGELAERVMVAEKQRDELRDLVRRFPPTIEIPDPCCEVGAEQKARGVDIPISVHEGTCPIVAADQPILSLREALAGDDQTWTDFIHRPYIWNDPERQTGRRIQWTPRGDGFYAGMGGHLWRSDRGPYSFCHRPACRLVHLRWDWASPCPAAPADEQTLEAAE